MRAEQSIFDANFCSRQIAVLRCCRGREQASCCGPDFPNEFMDGHRSISHDRGMGCLERRCIHGLRSTGSDWGCGTVAFRGHGVNVLPVGS